ncbi:MAG TPA: hypothetical protein VEU30_08050 [Thermoanaerobaculia bacterium]|nr:hypothetical protein [Thermoanaerobaculia bacterium]
MIRGAALAVVLLTGCEAPPASEPAMQSASPGIIVTGTYVSDSMRLVIDVGPDDEYRAHVGDVVVPATYDREEDCQRISFELPTGHFTGCLGAKAIVGRLGEERVYLVRR